MPSGAQGQPSPGLAYPLAHPCPLLCRPRGAAFPANRYTSYMTSSTSIDVSLKHKEMVSRGCLHACLGLLLSEVMQGVWGVEHLRSSMSCAAAPLSRPASLASLCLLHPCSDLTLLCAFRLLLQVILGTQYAGEMKKGVFSLMNYVLPKMGILSLHSGCNEGKDGDVTLFFGLSGALEGEGVHWLSVLRLRSTAARSSCCSLEVCRAACTASMAMLQPVQPIVPAMLLFAAACTAPASAAV